MTHSASRNNKIAKSRTLRASMSSSTRWREAMKSLVARQAMMLKSKISLWPKVEVEVLPSEAIRAIPASKRSLSRLRGKRCDS